jgi:putative Mg2+ transporter-C (MgtC) family protein
MRGILGFDVQQLVALAQIAIAMALGAVLGVERELARKPAGLRTHMLVAGSAALLVALGEVMIRRYGTSPDLPGVRGDPLRILSAVITGVSFLGAGTIIRRQDAHAVEGLTTAASILMAAAIGAAVALAQTALAVGATLLVFLILRGLHVVEDALRERR